MSTLKQNFAKIAFFAFLVAVLIFPVPTAVKSGVRTWKRMMAEKVDTGPVQYPVTVVAVGKHWTGLTYVDVKPNGKSLLGGRYQGQFWADLVQFRGLHVGDTIVLRANTRTWYYGKKKEVVALVHPLTEWRLITDRLTTDWKRIGQI